MRASIEHNFYAHYAQPAPYTASDGSEGEVDGGSGSAAALAAFSRASGNDVCADCGSTSGGAPDWVVMPYLSSSPRSLKSVTVRGTSSMNFGASRPEGLLDQCSVFLEIL